MKSKEPLPKTYDPAAVEKRGKDILKQGADGVFFFNFCCHHKDDIPRFNAAFKALSQFDKGC